MPIPTVLGLTQLKRRKIFDFWAFYRHIFEKFWTFRPFSDKFLTFSQVLAKKSQVDPTSMPIPTVLRFYTLEMRNFFLLLSPKPNFTTFSEPDFPQITTMPTAPTVPPAPKIDNCHVLRSQIYSK